MPTYQYVCTACDAPLEAVQSFSDAALTDCPVCSGRLRKVYGAVGVVFKGSGFYKNDSREAARKKAEAPAAKGDSGSSDSSASSGSNGSDGSSGSNGSSGSSGSNGSSGSSGSSSDSGSSSPTPATTSKPASTSKAPAVKGT